MTHLESFHLLILELMELIIYLDLPIISDLSFHEIQILSCQSPFRFIDDVLEEEVENHERALEARRLQDVVPVLGLAQGVGARAQQQLGRLEPVLLVVIRSHWIHDLEIDDLGSILAEKDPKEILDLC